MAHAIAVPIGSAALLERLRGLMLWLTGLAGAFVIMEPSPYEMVALATMALFFLTGLAAADGPTAAASNPGRLWHRANHRHCARTRARQHAPMDARFLVPDRDRVLLRLRARRGHRPPPRSAARRLHGRGRDRRDSGDPRLFPADPGLGRAAPLWPRQGHVQGPQRARAIPRIARALVHPPRAFRRHAELPGRRRDTGAVRGRAVSDLLARRLGAFRVFRRAVRGVPVRDQRRRRATAGASCWQAPPPSS